MEQRCISGWRDTCILHQACALAQVFTGGGGKAGKRRTASTPTSAPAFRHFIVVASNYSNLCGIPLKVIPQTNVIANGEKNLLAMFWRKGSDYLGVKYPLYPGGEQLSLTWQINNNCRQAPR